MQNVEFENNTIYGQPTENQNVAIEEASLAGPAAVAYAVPKLQVWTWPSGPEVQTDSITNSSNFNGTFLEAGADLLAIQAVRL